MVSIGVCQWALDRRGPDALGRAAELGFDTIQRLWPRLANQVHVKDGRDGKMGNAALGDGDAGFAATASLRRALGFDGGLISENDYAREHAGRAAQDVATLTRLFASDSMTTGGG